MIDIIRVAEDAIWAIRGTQGTQGIEDAQFKYVCFFCGKLNNFSKDYCEKCDYDSDMGREQEV